MMYILSGDKKQIINSDFVERFCISEKPDAALIVASYDKNAKVVTVARYRDLREAQRVLGNCSAPLQADRRITPCRKACCTRNSTSAKMHASSGKAAADYDRQRTDTAARPAGRSGNGRGCVLQDPQQHLRHGLPACVAWTSSERCSSSAPKAMSSVTCRRPTS